MKHAIRREFIYIFVRIAADALLLLPIRIAVFLGGSLGVLVFHLLAKHRKQAIENLQLAFGAKKSEKEIRRIAKAVFANFGKSVAEFISFPKINSSNIDRFVKARGVEKLDQAFKDKKGAIILSCHLGNWELSAAYLGLKGYPPNPITRPLRDERFNRIVNLLRRSKGVNSIPRDSSFRKIVSILKANQIVGILPDQDIASVDGAFVNFFNRPAYTPTGPAALAMISGAPMFFMFCIRQDNVHQLIIEGPIELEDTGGREKDLLVNTQKWSGLAEQYIRRYPEQWAWFHRRWKTQPK